MKRLVFISLLATMLTIAGCVSGKLTGGSRDLNDPKPRDYDHVYTSPFPRVWRAVQLSIPTRYSLSVNQMETGTIETDWISSVDGYDVPYEKKKPSVGTRYKLILTLVKGQSTEGHPVIRVSIRKQMERKNDFFSEPELQVSDGMEEEAILYRVNRELVIEQAILKSQNQKAPGTS